MLDGTLGAYIGLEYKIEFFKAPNHTMPNRFDF